MSDLTLPRLVIAGTNSGCGKTTVTCAVLTALVERGLTPTAFKCGPDYIDPMFHSRVTGIRARNIDTFLTGRSTALELFKRNAASGDISVIEGVMGYYDGAAARSDSGSTADIARLTASPTVLVMNPRGMALTAAAIVSGMTTLRENTIKAVILNGVSPKSAAYYRDIIEGETGIPVLGVMPHIEKAELQSRHLGLVTAAEVADLNARLHLLAEAASEQIDLDSLLELAGSAPDLPAPPGRKTAVRNTVKIAVAADDAFCFRYEDSLDALRDFGAELVEFSPFSDAALPTGCAALYLCGGYPELYADTLSRNASMRASIADAIRGGMPTIAECGGFMYLHERLEGHEMAGIIPGEAKMTPTLRRFGYFTMTAIRDNLLCRAGDTINAHEFHYSASENEGSAFGLTKPSQNIVSARTGHASGTLYAGYPHFSFAGNFAAAQRFVEAAVRYSEGLQ